MIRQWSCDEHIKCVAYDTEVLPAGEEGADRGPFAAVLAASGTFQVQLSTAASGTLISPRQEAVACHNCSHDTCDETTHVAQIWDLTTGKLKHTAKKAAPKVRYQSLRDSCRARSAHHQHITSTSPAHIIARRSRDVCSECSFDARPSVHRLEAP